MTKEFPKWFLLIYCWCVSKHRSGLTIPFIIGVEGSSIRDLLTEIANCPVPEKVVLKYCSDLHEYVLGLDEKEHSIVEYIFPSARGLAPQQVQQ